jgi:hypothetical protein
MLKRGMFLFLVILASCSNPPVSKDINGKTAHRVKSKTSAVKPVSNPWTISSFAPKEGETEGRKFVRFVTEGDFSDSTRNKSYLYADLIINTTSAGIFLHESKKSSPSEKFNGPVQIDMTNSSGQELQMNSTKSWNNSGGILIERNNNDYSQLRIFLLQSKGTITVEIKASGTKIYHFNINADGFGDSFTKL